MEEENVVVFSFVMLVEMTGARRFISLKVMYSSLSFSRLCFGYYCMLVDCRSTYFVFRPVTVTCHTLKKSPCGIQQENGDIPRGNSYHSFRRTGTGSIREQTISFR